jgi:hypothetical protein
VGADADRRGATVMAERNDGGAAFPTLDYFCRPDGTGGAPVSEGGMTLRDYFAAAALAGMFASNSQRDVAAEIKKSPHAFCLEWAELAAAANSRLAVMAYAMADAMLQAREES